MSRSTTIAYEPDIEVSLALELDPDGSDELFSFRKKEKENLPEQPDKPFRPSEQQLLSEGKLGDSELSARIRKAIFGTFAGTPACLILIRVDFCPKGGGRGWFRFRSATIGVEFSDIDPPHHGPETPDKNESDDDDNSDEDEEEDGPPPNRPLVLDLYPTSIRGHIQTTAQKYGIKGSVSPLASGVVGAEVFAEKTFLREGLHLVHGRIVGDQTGAKWSMSENEVSSSGIYEQPTFAVVVGFEEGKGFAMRLAVEARTYGGLAVKGKRRPRIAFRKGKKAKDEVLDGMDLEEMTEMRKNLLGKEGPGGGRAVVGAFDGFYNSDVLSNS